ncbi:cyclic nucleotide-binding domain-containing protein [bacterium]|nr:cyclic nucleotide-binding domain-containing protein [bacterium]
MQLTSTIPGQIIFRQGETSQTAYIIEEGEVEIFSPTPNGNVLLATLGKGQIFGEMGLIDGQVRSASAVAKTACQLRVVTAEALISILGQLPQEFTILLRALSERLRETNGKLGNAIAKYHQMRVLAPGETRQPEMKQLSFLPATAEMEKVVPKDGLAIKSFPFRVGGIPPGEADNPLDWNDVMIPGANPLLLSRNHFAIQKTNEGLLVVDRGSACGTLVNGTGIGLGQPDYKAALKPGRNTITAGGQNSPYQFIVRWE